MTKKARRRRMIVMGIEKTIEALVMTAVILGPIYLMGAVLQLLGL